MPRLNLYAQNRHVVVIDGFPLDGFDEGEFLEFEHFGNAGELTEGGDGPAMSLSTPQGGKITLGLLPTSKWIGDMYGLRDAQAANPRMFSIVVSSGVNEIIRGSGCAFGPLPSYSSGGPKMSGRKFVFNCLQLKSDTSAVEAIEGGLIGGVVPL